MFPSWNRSHSESFTESLLWKRVFLQTADCGTTFTKEMQSHNGLLLYYLGHGPEFSWVLTFSAKLNLSVHSGAISLFKAGPKWECWVSCLVWLFSVSHSRGAGHSLYYGQALTQCQMSLIYAKPPPHSFVPPHPLTPHPPTLHSAWLILLSDFVSVVGWWYLPGGVTCNHP